MILDDEGLRRVALQLRGIGLARDNGPEQDSFPRRIRGDGDIVYGRSSGLDLRALKLSTDGGQARLSGDLDPMIETIEEASLALEVEDGSSFLRAFGIEPYFAALEAELGLSGALMAPSGQGRLSVQKAGTESFALGDIRDAKMWMERGTLHIRNPDTRLFGGRGPLEADLVLFEHGQLLSDPKIRVFLDLTDIDQKSLLDRDLDVKNVELRLYVDDGNDKPVPLSKVAARGALYAESLNFGPEEYRDAEASFSISEEGIRVERINLAYHRPVSPMHSPHITIPVGEITGEGTIGFETDPSIDVRVRADGVPLSAMAAVLGEEELPVEGKLGKGSSLRLGGSIGRPKIDGNRLPPELGSGRDPAGAGLRELRESGHRSVQRRAPSGPCLPPGEYLRCLSRRRSQQGGRAGPRLEAHRLDGFR